MRPHAHQSGPDARAAPAVLLACATALLAVTIIAYLPAFSADFIQWDDQYYVSENRLLHDVAGLKKIWNPRAKGGTDQYYPLTFTSYWIEYRLWRLNAYAYHATNVVLHLVNTLLVWLVISAFGVSWRAAAMTAGVFALHPVQVASVVWISERKNTLSTVFYLLTFFLYLQHRRRARWGLYGASLFAYAAALLSKTQTLTLPGSLLLADWVLQRLGRLPHRSLGRLAAGMIPFLVLTAVAGVNTMVFEARPWTRDLPFLHRVLVAANAAWFYAGTFVLPIRLSPIYPEWELSGVDARWWWAVIAWAPLGALLLYRHRRVPLLAFWAAAHFYIALAPVLGFFAFNFQTYSFVADHFLYLSVIGGGLIVALAVDSFLDPAPGPLWRGGPPTAHEKLAPAPKNPSPALPARGGEGSEEFSKRWPVRRLLTAAAVLLLITAGAALTYREARHWRTNRAFWRRVVERYPNSFFGYFNLGHHYRGTGEWEKAVYYYRRATAIRPKAGYAFRWYADALGHAEGPRAVVEACNARIAGDPNFYFAYYDRALAYTRLGRRHEALADFRRVLQLAPRGSKYWQSARRRMERGRPARSRR